MIPVMSRTAILFFDWLFSKVTSSRCSRACRPDFAFTVTTWTKCRKLLRKLKTRRRPSTIAIFIQAFPRRGGRGGGGGAIRGGGFDGMIGGGGGAWPGAFATSFSIAAEAISWGWREQARFGIRGGCTRNALVWPRQIAILNRQMNRLPKYEPSSTCLPPLLS